MTYTIQWSSQINGDTGSTAPNQIGKATISLPDNSTDNSTTITLTGRGLSGYGMIQQENFVRLMENFASEQAPNNPTVGQIWFDTSNNTLQVYKITTPGASPVLNWDIVYPVAAQLGYTPYNASNPAGYLNKTTLITAVAGDGSEAQVIVGSNVNGVTLATPQAIDSAASPTFNKITISSSPINATDVVTKAYVDAQVTGLTWKNAVVVATTANITLSGEQSIDGIITSSSRVLVKNQTNQTQNGIYTSHSGSWVRTLDADTGAEIVGTAVYIEQGTVGGGTAWTCTNATITLGTTNIAFVQFGGATLYTGGTGINVSGTTISNTGVTKNIAGTGISVSPIGGTGNVTITNSGVTSLTGTSGQISVSANTGAITLSLPSTINVNISGNSATVGGFSPSQSSGIGSRIVVADASGYINNTFINTTDNIVGSGVSGVIIKAGDNYHRTGTAQAVASFISGTSMNISGNATTANSSSSASVSTTRSTADNSTNIATTAFVHALIASSGIGSSSLAPNGYIVLGGLIIQWGSFTPPSGSNVFVSFPRSFTSQCYSVVNSQPQPVSYGYPLSIISFSTSGFTVGNQPNGGNTCYYVAIGV